MGHGNKQGKSPGFVLLFQRLKGQGHQESHEPGRVSSNCPALSSTNMTQQLEVLAYHPHVGPINNEQVNALSCAAKTCPAHTSCQSEQKAEGKLTIKRQWHEAQRNFFSLSLGHGEMRSSQTRIYKCSQFIVQHRTRGVAQGGAEPSQEPDLV